jgi:hypothetical protein
MGVTTFLLAMRIVEAYCNLFTSVFVKVIYNNASCCVTVHYQCTVSNEGFINIFTIKKARDIHRE